MNKIFIALVLAVVMSGNVFAKQVYIYCSKDMNIGYIIGKTIDPNDVDNFVIHYDKYQDKIEQFMFWNYKMEVDYFYFNLVEDKLEDAFHYRLNRKTLRLEKFNNRLNYVYKASCSFKESYDELFKLVKKINDKKLKKNKF